MMFSCVLHIHYSGACVIHKYGVCRYLVLCLAVQVIFVVIVEIALAASACRRVAPRGAVREPEVVTKAAALLKSLREHLVLLDVVVGHRPPGELHGLLEVRLSDLWHQVLLVVYVHGGGARLLFLLFSLNVCINTLPDSELASTLADFSQVGTGEPPC